MTISNTDSTSGGTSVCSTWPRSVGQSAVARADLAAAAGDRAREGHDRALDLAHGARRGLGRAQRRLVGAGEDDDVAPGHALDHAEALLHEELALHHRHAPVAPAVEDLAGLIAVAEVAQLPADVDGVLRVQAVEARRRRARQHGLADALHEPLAHALRVHREEQGAHARPPVGGLAGVELALDAGLA